MDDLASNTDDFTRVDRDGSDGKGGTALRPCLMAIGAGWVKQARSAVLELPSVIIAGESNYLLNTSHPDFKSITIGKAEVFSFDSRLVP